MSIYTNKIYFSFGLKIRAIIKAKAIEAVIPVAADFIPPENIPINPDRGYENEKSTIHSFSSGNVFAMRPSDCLCGKYPVIFF